MRPSTTGVLCVVTALLTADPTSAALPIRRPDAEAVERVVPATDAEKESGVVVVVFLKD